MVKLKISPIIFAILLMSTVAFAQPQLSGPQSGALGPGTYLVVGDIRINPGATLTIAPGTEFLHNGAWKWEVGGLLNINGAEGDSVVFKRQQPIENHKWRGIRFLAGSSVESTVDYAVIEWCKYPSGGVYYGLGIYMQVGITVSNSRISDCWSYWDGAGIYVSNCTATIDNCIIADNTAGSGANGGGIVLNQGTGTQITNCIIARNSATGT